MSEFIGVQNQLNNELIFSCMPEANPSIFTLTNLGGTSLPLENNS